MEYNNLDFDIWVRDMKMKLNQKNKMKRDSESI